MEERCMKSLCGNASVRFEIWVEKRKYHILFLGSILVRNYSGVEAKTDQELLEETDLWLFLWWEFSCRKCSLHSVTITSAAWHISASDAVEEDGTELLFHGNHLLSNVHMARSTSLQRKKSQPLIYHGLYSGSPGFTILMEVFWSIQNNKCRFNWYWKAFSHYLHLKSSQLMYTVVWIKWVRWATVEKPAIESNRCNSSLCSWWLAGNLLTQENIEHGRWSDSKCLESVSDSSQWSASASPSKSEFQDGNIQGRIIRNNKIRVNLKVLRRQKMMS